MEIIANIRMIFFFTFRMKVKAKKLYTYRKKNHKGNEQQTVVDYFRMRYLLAVVSEYGYQKLNEKCETLPTVAKKRKLSFEVASLRDVYC